jgi:hypothetical protein
MSLPQITVKMAYGHYKEDLAVNQNWRMGYIVELITNSIRRCCGDSLVSDIEVVFNKHDKYNELNNAISSSDYNTKLYNYILRESIVIPNRPLFYARVVCLIENDTYIKSDCDLRLHHEPSGNYYLKKKDMEDIKHGTKTIRDVEILTENSNRIQYTLQCRQDALSAATRETSSAITQCIICAEHPCSTTTHYSCNHCFCNSCFTNWHNNGHFNCPLCRSCET